MSLFCISIFFIEILNLMNLFFNFTEKFPEAIVTKCKKCTNKQKEMFEKIVVFYTEKEPEKWNTILVKAIKDSQKSTTKKTV
jgi:NAD-dependent SIR2 family protein deacetylase